MRFLRMTRRPEDKASDGYRSLGMGMRLGGLELRMEL